MVMELRFVTIKPVPPDQLHPVLVPERKVAKHVMCLLAVPDITSQTAQLVRRWGMEIIRQIKITHCINVQNRRVLITRILMGRAQV